MNTLTEGNVSLKILNGKLALIDVFINFRYIWEWMVFHNEATIVWDVGYNVKPGVYRIHHYGHYKFGGVFPYEGLSNNFQVI